MSKIISISDKLSSEKSYIELNGKQYEVNTDMETVLLYEELIVNSSGPNLEKAFIAALGEEAVSEINLRKMSLKNMKVLMTAITAIMQDIEYEEVEKRFRSIQQ